MNDWNDIKIFIAVVRAGSLNRASQLLGISQPTVGRRIAVLESQLGVVLFDKHHKGMSLTKAGKSMWDKALRMETAANGLEQEALSQNRQVQQVIKISATEGIGTFVLTPALIDLRTEHPQTSFQVFINNNAVDLMQRDADIAVRLSRPVIPDLIAKKVALLEFQLFASQDYINRFGQPQSLEKIAKHQLVTFSLRDAIIDQTWLDILNTQPDIAYQTNSSIAHVAATRAGLGIGLLPKYITHYFDDLVPILTPDLWKPREVWIVAHPDMKRVAIIKNTFDFIARALKQVATKKLP